MRSDIERCLDGDLQRVLDEPLFANVAADGVRVCRSPQRLDRRHDDGECFLDEGAIGHVARAARAMASAR